MKRLQVYIDERLDEALTMRARRERRSKAALIREWIAGYMKDFPTDGDPFDEWIGKSEGGAGDIDEVVYGG